MYLLTQHAGDISPMHSRIHGPVLSLLCLYRPCIVHKLNSPVTGPPLLSSKARQTIAARGSSAGKPRTCNDATVTHEAFTDISLTNTSGEPAHGDSFLVRNEIWTALKDETTSRLYFRNEATRATQWTDPRSEMQTITRVGPTDSLLPPKPPLHSRTTLVPLLLLLLAVAATSIWAQLGPKLLKRGPTMDPDPGGCLQTISPAPLHAEFPTSTTDASAESSGADRDADCAPVQSDRAEGPGGSFPHTESSSGAMLVDDVLTDSENHKIGDRDADLGVNPLEAVDNFTPFAVSDYVSDQMSDKESGSVLRPEKQAAQDSEDNEEGDGVTAVTAVDLGGVQLQLVAAGHCIPHPAKAAKGGEDAYFVSGLHRGVIAVSDGVSAWAEEGIDPADYSRCLMAEAEAALTRVDWLSTDDGVLDILSYAHERTTMAGSATACIGFVRGGGMVLLNLGDSGFRIIRGGQCAFASQAQTHSFNTPYQLAHPNHVPETYIPVDGQIYDIELDDGDIIVMATDGLFDNVWDDDIAALVHSRLKGTMTRESTLAQRVAEGLAELAHSAARDSQSRTPWMRAAMSSMRAMRPLGGKMDDVTVVVGFLETARTAASMPA